METDLGNKTTSEFRTIFHSPLGLPNSEVPLYYVEYYTIYAIYTSQRVLVHAH